MPHLQGTLGFYFTGGGKSKDILAATAHCDLFLSDEENSDYTCTKDSMPCKNSLFMGTMAWQDYLQSVQIEMGTLALWRRFMRTILVSECWR